MSTAETFRKHLTSVEAGVNAEPDGGGMAIIGIRNPDNLRRNLIVDPGNIESQLSAYLSVIIDRYVEESGVTPPPPATTPWPLHLEVGHTSHEVLATGGTGQPVTLRFADGSTLRLARHIVPEIIEEVGVVDSVSAVISTDTSRVKVDGPEAATGRVADRGPELLKPVTADERHAVDKMITRIERLAAEDYLDDLHKAQLRVIVGIFEDARDGATPGVTPRHETVTRVRAAWQALARHLPEFASGLFGAGTYELLKAIAWSDTAEFISELMEHIAFWT